MIEERVGFWGILQKEYAESTKLLIQGELPHFITPEEDWSLRERTARSIGKITAVYFFPLFHPRYEIRNRKSFYSWRKRGAFRLNLGFLSRASVF